MPFTPFHFGPALLFATLFGYLDFLTFMIANEMHLYLFRRKLEL